jgi:ELWxxDGT repeat protein
MFSFRSWVRGLQSSRQPSRTPITRATRRRQSLSVTALEDRSVPTATLVKDINLGQLFTSITDIEVMGQTVFVSAYTDATGQELWILVPDGTTASLLKDISPGPGRATCGF